MLRIGPRHDPRLQQQDREQSADQRDLAQVRVRFAPVEDQQDPEDRQQQRVPEQRTHDAANRVRRGCAAAQQLLMQRDEPLMRFIRDDFVRRDDAVARAHDVFAGIDAAP